MTNEQIDALIEPPAGVAPPTGKDPSVIYLEQSCCADGTGEGRHWAQDMDCLDGCDDGVAPTKYVRADIVRELCKEVKAWRRKEAERLERLVDNNRWKVPD